MGGSEAISDPDLDPDLSRLLLGWAPGRPFSSCCPDTGQTQDEGVRAGRLRARRRYLVERARDARVVGLLAGTLGVARHREALAHLRNLTQAAGKRSYVLALGRPTPAKLANFPEVDVFVLLACPLGTLAPQPSGGFFRPVLAPCELEAACNPAWPPPGLAPTLPPTEPLPHSGRVTNPGHVSKFPYLQRCKREGKERGKEGKGERKERNGKGVTNSSTIK